MSVRGVTCARGHDDWRVHSTGRGMYCRVCRAQADARRRARMRAAQEDADLSRAQRTTLQETYGESAWGAERGWHMTTHEHERHTNAEYYGESAEALIARHRTKDG